MGIEKAPDAVALVSMGCDFGQGFLLGQPMPEERFISLLRQRAATQGHDLPAAGRAVADVQSTHDLLRMAVTRRFADHGGAPNGSRRRGA